MPAAAIAQRLMADRDSGRLAQLCAPLGIDLLVLFGSVRKRPATAKDVDVAYSFRHGYPGDHLAVVNTLGTEYGDLIDVMPLDRAGVVARYAALGEGEVLVELTPEKFAKTQMAAFGEYCDTQHFRDADLEALTR